MFWVFWFGVGFSPSVILEIYLICSKIIEKENVFGFRNTKADPKYSIVKNGTVQIDVFYLTILSYSSWIQGSSKLEKNSPVLSPPLLKPCFPSLEASFAI